MAATAVTEATDGPVMSFINKRIRNLRKKYKRIIQIEEALSQGKPINKEQEDVLLSKPGLCAVIDELEKLRNPLSVAVSEEVDLAVQRRQELSLTPPPPQPQQSADDSAKASVTDDDEIRATEEARSEESNLGVVEDLLNLLYFGSLFDVKTQNDFTSTMFTRTHERGCCLTYDYVTDEATDLLGERDLDMLSMLGGLVISRPVNSSLSHKNALQRCIEHAKHWIANSNQPIDSDSSVTYAELRERLTKIMATDYFTTTPEMKAPVDVAAVAAGNYASFQVPGHASMVVPVQAEGAVDQYQQKDDDTEDLQVHEAGDSQPSLEEEFQKDEFVTENPAEVVSANHEMQYAEAEEYQRDVESKDQQYNPRRAYPNQRGGRGGGGGGGSRRGYSNGRGGRSGGRGGGPYQNGRNQFYDQPTNYYPRNNYYNNRGRGGRGGGGQSFNNHGSAGHAASVDVGSVS